MTNKKVWQIAILDAVLTAVYLAIISTLMTYGGAALGTGATMISGLVILLLFSISTVVVASLVFGQPILMLFENEKKGAIRTLIYTVLVLAVIIIIAFIVLGLTSR